LRGWLWRSVPLTAVPITERILIHDRGRER